MPSQLAFGVRGTVAGHRLGALEKGGGGAPPPSNASLMGHWVSWGALSLVGGGLGFGGGFFVWDWGEGAVKERSICTSLNSGGGDGSRG